jgi:hypothetical protein
VDAEGKLEPLAGFLAGGDGCEPEGDPQPHISEVLKVAQGKIYGSGGAAELLGVKPTTLRWRMDQLGIRYRRRDQGTN